MIRNFRTLSVFAGLVAAAGALSISCSKRGSSSTGDVKIAFNIPSGDQINSVHYVVTESEKTSAIVQGDMDTHDAGAKGSLNIAVPPTAPGATDTVILTATTKNGLICTSGGSAAFAVVPKVASTVMLTLACGTGSHPTVPGTVNVTSNVAVADNCPSITSAVVAPGQTSVGGKVRVSATGTDPDLGDSITYSWGPTASQFANATAASTTFTCTLPGLQQITLSITDSRDCIAQVNLMVNCLPLSSGEGVAMGGPATGGVGQSAACTICEQDGVTAGYCMNTQPVNPKLANGQFGCAGFKSATDQKNCFALVNCLRGSVCQNAIHSADASFNEAKQSFDSPLPCLCGTAFDGAADGAASACATATSGWNGVCSAQFIAASANAIDRTAEPTRNYANQNYPEGVAKQLMQCDMDNHCISKCQ
jgi:hypothetical protein